MKKTQFAGLVITLIASMGVIFFKFNRIPSLTFFDEIEFARLALDLGKKGYTPYSAYATGHPTLYYYVLLASLKILGISSFALRIPSAVFGVLGSVFFYATMLVVFERNKKNAHYLLTVFLATIATIILSTSRWYFNFARYSFEATFLLFLELATTLFLFRFLKTRKTLHLVLATVFAALAYNSYAPGRIFFILIPIFLALAIRQNRLFLKKSQVVLASTAFLLLILPLTAYLFTHSDIRFNQQFFLKNSSLSLQEKALYLQQSTTRTLKMFATEGDYNGRHNYPAKAAINPILLGLLVLGMARALRNYRNRYNMFFLLYFLLSTIPSIVTYPWENPNMLRTFTMLPSIAYFCTYALDLFITITTSKAGKKISYALVFAFALLVIASTTYEIRTYFKYQADVFTEVPSSVEDISKADLSLREKSIGR